MADFTVRKIKEQEYKQWDDFVDGSPQGTLFAKTIWLRASGKNHYILGCFDKSSRLCGGMPVVEAGKGCIGMPPLTQTLGIILGKGEGMKYASRITREKDIISALVEEIQTFKCFEQGFHYNFTNWMPFMWKGYSQYTRYTYVIENIGDLDKVRAEFTDNTKNTINKALKSNLKVVDDLSLETMYKLVEKTFSRQNMKIPFGFSWFEQFDRVLRDADARQMFFAVDDKGNVHSALYLVYDCNCAYYLLGGGDPEFRSSGAMYLNVFEAIRFASKYTDTFDFEGSIVPGIEHTFRSFGGKQKAYFHISRNRSIWSNMKIDVIKYGKLLFKR